MAYLPAGRGDAKVLATRPRRMVVKRMSKVEMAKERDRRTDRDKERKCRPAVEKA